MCDVFGRIVYQAIGKYINPTRYRQIIETESVIHLDINDQQSLSRDQKHTSNVAKVHYQKLKSRDVAEQGKACMGKLRNLSHNSINETTVNNCFSNAINSSVNRDCRSAPVRNKKIAFSSLEDKFICEGIRKHGHGQWTAILNDSSYYFHPSRKSATLAVRAKTKQFV